MLNDTINTIRSYIKHLGFNSVWHRIAIITPEQKRPSIHSAIFKLSYEKKSKPYEKIYSFEGVDIFEAQYTIEEFDEVLTNFEHYESQYLHDLGHGKELGTGEDLPEDLRWSVDGLRVNLSFSFSKGQLYGSDEKFSHVKNEEKNPLWIFQFSVNHNYIANIWPEADFSKSRPAYENPQDCINDHLGLQYFTNNNSPFFGIVMPITKAKIQSCKINGNSVKIKLFFEESFQPKNLFLNAICETSERKERPSKDLTKNDTVVEFKTKFVPDKVTLHLIDGNLKLDSYSQGQVKFETDLDNSPFVGAKIKDKDPDAKKEPALKNATVFISHAMDDYRLAKNIKIVLEDLGIDAFIAHQDIPPFEKWEDAIFNEIKSSPIFVPLLTWSFKKSEWTDQESGIAVTSNSEVLPVIIDMDPYGFIKKYQGLRWTGAFFSDISNLASQIIDRLSTTNRARIRQRVIENFGNHKKCSSFDIAGVFARVISSFPSLTEDEIEQIAQATINNEQISGSRSAATPLRELLNKYKGKLPKEYYRNNILAWYIR